MSVDRLPPEILLVIFNCLDQLDDLIRCSKVCLKWHSLIFDRCCKIEYLLETPSIDSLDNVVYVSQSLDLDTVNLDHLFPKLRILDASLSGLSCWKDAASQAKSIKGLIYHTLDKDLSRAHFLRNLEMVSTEMMDFFFLNRNIVRQLKQIAIQAVDLVKMKGITGEMWALKRLHVIDKNCNQKLYKGSRLNKLKILEFGFDSLAGVLVYPGFCFMDFCPALESAFFHCESTYCQFNLSVKNFNLRDLVIEYLNDNPREWSPFFRIGGHAQKWDILRMILRKFPNLQHLALRNNLKLCDEDIDELLRILPKLTLLDVRGSSGIGPKSLIYVNQYCKQSNKEIKFYFDTDIDKQIDWPELSFTGPDICRGFDFMRNCFFKTFLCLPLLMDTDEQY